MKNLIHWMTLVFFALFSSCVSTKYHKPIELTQEEISSMRITDQNHNEVPLSPGRIRNCKPSAITSSTECSVIICKEDSSTETKFKCEIHIPESMNIKDGKGAQLAHYSNIEETKKIDSAINEYNNGTSKSLQNYCSQENVVCYFNKKFYPDSKIATQFSSNSVTHKNTYELKSNSKIEITVYKPR
jgi:hypothetical protein